MQHIRAFELFNLLQGRSADPLLLLDVRSKDLYSKQHIASAINLQVSDDGDEALSAESIEKAQTSCVALSKIRNRKASRIVIYHDDETDMKGASRLATLFESEGIQRYAILKGGFVGFYEKYPFTCVEGDNIGKLSTMYPAEIIEDFLFLGGQKNAESLEQMEVLRISGVVNAAAEMANMFPESREYHNVNLHDTEGQEITSVFPGVEAFLNRMFEEKKRVLVHCAFGQSRSATLVIAYLMLRNSWLLDTAFDHLSHLKEDIHPNVGFMKQLRSYDRTLQATRCKSERINDAVLLSGSLLKKGGAKGHSRNWMKGGSRALRHRWIELTPKELFYYPAKGQPPNGHLDLVGASLDRSQEKPLRFFVITSSRDMEFEASSVEEMEEWMTAIQAVIDSHRK